MVPIIVESFGAIAPHAVALLRGWARTARTKKLKKKLHWSAPTYLTYHLQCISAAAAAANAAHVLDMIQVDRARRRIRRSTDNPAVFRSPIRSSFA